MMMRITPVVRAPAGSPIANIAEGFGYVIRTKPVLALLLLLGLVSLMGMPYSVLMPIFAEQILQGDSSTLGFLMGASGAGALAAALVLASRKHVFGLGRWVMLACGGFGISLVLFSFSRSFWLSALLLVPVGFAMKTQMSSSNTLIQAMIPDELRGRVMAVYSMMFMGMAPLGSLLAGTLAGIIGAPETVALGGVICVIAAVVFRYVAAPLQEEGRRMIVSMQMTGGEPASKAIGHIQADVVPRSARN